MQIRMPPSFSLRLSVRPIPVSHETTAVMMIGLTAPLPHAGSSSPCALLPQLLVSTAVVPLSQLSHM